MAEMNKAHFAAALAQSQADHGEVTKQLANFQDIAARETQAEEAERTRALQESFVARQRGWEDERNAADRRIEGLLFEVKTLRGELDVSQKIPTRSTLH